MNWTGGTLQRTKHANKGVRQKQKAYFARARTQLQQSPSTPAASFRPDYLRDGDDLGFGHRLPSLGSDSVRHSGRYTRKRRKEERDYPSPTIQKPRHLAGQRNSQKTSSHFSQGRRNSRADNEKQQERKRSNANTDNETQLLEANKKRLLRQQDWIGVAPSRPVDMQFLSIKEKRRIGKRRRLDGKSKAPTCRHSLTTFLHQTGQSELAGNYDTFMSGALPVLTAADSIRIRIGSDALTTAASTQPNHYAQSQTNSDSMLFDKEGEDAAQRIESEAPRGTTPASHANTANPRSIDRVKFDRSYSPQQGPYAHHNLTKRPDHYANERVWYTAAELDALDRSVHKSEATDPSYRLTHYVAGIERPLKLVFGKRDPSIVSHKASPTHQIGELQRVHADFDAKGTETGLASRNVGEVSQSIVRRQPQPPATIDEEPWGPYLDTSTSSSGHVRVDDGTGTNVPQPHVPARNTQADRTSWPQHTAQANLTHVNLSKVSTSLPASHRRSGLVLDARPLPRTNAVKEVNNDEAAWRSWAIGSDPQSVMDTIHSHNGTSEDSMSRATKGYASTRLPLSNAVTSVSSTPFPSTPFKSLSGQASCISDDVQYGPHSGFRSITSTAPYGVWGRIDSPNEDAQGEDQGEETPARSRFGEQSTHASLQDHASHDSAMFSDTRTSRIDLDQRGHAWDDVSRRAQASGSVGWQRSRGSSICDIPDSDEARIDLIDPDRLA